MFSSSYVTGIHSNWFFLDKDLHVDLVTKTLIESVEICLVLEFCFLYVKICSKKISIPFLP